MKILCLSDTHNQHDSIPSEYINNKDGLIETIIHAGDMTLNGGKSEVIDFLNWYTTLPFKYKILIAGNHDFYFERNEEEIKDLLKSYPNIIYLNDTGIRIDNILFWGSPVQPWFYDWAFNKRGSEILEHWDKIPKDVNVLITHGPIKGILDENRQGDKVGCQFLSEKIKDFTDLKLHVCGHIHEGYGRLENEKTIFINASLLNYKYYMTNTPIEVKI